MARRVRIGLWGLGLLALATVALSGCSGEPIPLSTDAPTSGPETTAGETPGTDGLLPGQTEGGDASDGGDAGVQPDVATAQEVRIGEEDLTSLDWRISCSGLDTSPTVIASAEDEEGVDHVIVLVGAGTDSLASFSYTETAPGESSRDRSGLNVNPGSKHGNGSIILDGLVVSSTGRGVSYDGADVAEEADTVYSVEFRCAG
ncbi:hypothetical protein [Gulosibacter sp. 10]|uniref:hypothetical protein n=1 Tax=Gulosibacter sp. 10 TaxID=1255570 RepID=UPI0011249D69|nr:hypothetical protein [Gulosibacter sp. 10]